MGKMQNKQYAPTTPIDDEVIKMVTNGNDPTPERLGEILEQLQEGFAEHIGEIVFSEEEYWIIHEDEAALYVLADPVGGHWGDIEHFVDLSDRERGSLQRAYDRQLCRWGDRHNRKQEMITQTANWDAFLLNKPSDAPETVLR